MTSHGAPTLRRSSLDPSRPPWTWDLCALGAYLALTLAITWPLVLQLGTAVPKDLGDPLFSTWAIWWNAQVVPFSEAWWNAPIFYPAGNAMALADHRVGLGVITTPLIWAGASPLIAYNVAFLASFFLSAAAGYALSLTVTGHRPAALVGGLVFGFHPFRAAHLEHVELLSSYWLAVALLCLHRWVGSRSRWPLAGLAVALTLQALTSGYYFFYALLLIAGWIVWFALRQSSWTQLAELAAALAAPLLAIAPVLWRYRTTHTELGLGRSVYEVEQLSADIAGFAATPSFLAFWNLPFVPANPEVALFPGLTAIAVVMVAVGLRTEASSPRPTWRRFRLACVGLAIVAAAVAVTTTALGPFAYRLGPIRFSVSNLYKPMSVAAVFALAWLVTLPRVRDAWGRRSPLAFYVLATLAMWLLAVGPTARFLGERVLYKAPYAWLMLLPGFSESLRAPARFAMLAAMTLAVAAALALTRLAARTTTASGALFAVVVAGVLADGWIEPLPLPPPPPAMAAIDAVPADAVVMELPLGIFEDTAAMYRSMAHGHRLANGYSGYAPPHYTVLGLALEEGRTEALAALEIDRDMAIVVARGGGPTLADAVARALPAARVEHTADADVFHVPGQPPTPFPPAPGRPLPVRAIVASVGRDAEFIADGTIGTVWTTTPDLQAGGEQVTVDLGAPTLVSALELDQGKYSFAYPRLLGIEVSDDGAGWREVWRGDAATLALRGAMAEPALVPLRITFEPTTARYLRLTQHGQAKQAWAIAELIVFGPPSP